MLACLLLLYAYTTYYLHMLFLYAILYACYYALLQYILGYVTLLLYYTTLQFLAKSPYKGNFKAFYTFLTAFLPLFLLLFDPLLKCIVKSNHNKALDGFWKSFYYIKRRFCVELRKKNLKKFIKSVDFLFLCWYIIDIATRDKEAAKKNLKKFIKSVDKGF